MNILPIKFDTYNKRTPAFCGHSRNLQTAIDSVIIKQNITNKDKEFLIDRICKAIPTTLIPEKFLGLGTHKLVYSITRKYAARVSTSEINPNALGNDLKFGQGIFKKLRYYFGEPVVELGDFQILKNLGKHIPAGIPEHKIPKMSLNEQIKYYITKYLPAYSKLPQIAYDDLAKDIEKLNQIKLGEHRFCTFDSLNPNNIVTKNSHLFIVDEIYTLYDKPYGNTTAKLFEVLINRMHKSQDSPVLSKCTNLYRKIFAKTILAAEKTEMIHADTNSDYKNWEKALQRCAISTPAYEVIENLERIHNENKDVIKRNTKVKSYLNKLFVQNSSK